MDIFSRVLQGSYAYLLVFQILIVAGLMLTLLWLIVQRTKQGLAPETVNSDAPQRAGVNSAELEALKRRALQLEEDLARTVKMREEYESLQQKVKFLESKLLEYEILQEEIGTLSALKVENEKLKKELVVLQGEIDKKAATKAAGKPEAPVEPTSLSEAAAPTSEVIGAAPPPPAEPAASSTPPAPAETTPNAAAPASGDPNALDGLLAEIDAIASAPVSHSDG